MTHFNTPNNKNHHGFTLFEVMIALVLLSFVMPPFFNLFSSVMGRIEKVAYTFDHILQAKQFLLSKRDRKTLPAINDTHEKEAGVTIHYERAPVDERSQPFASLHGLHKEIVTVSWNDPIHGMQDATLLSFIYIEPEEKKDQR